MKELNKIDFIANIFINLIFILSLYVYIYSPVIQVINIGLGKILWLFALVYFTFKFKELKYLRYFASEIIFLIVIIIYLYITTIWGDGTTDSLPYQHFQFIIDCIIIPIFIYSYFSRKINISKIIQYLIIVGVLAALISVLFVMFPEINFYIRENIIIDDLDLGTDTDNIKYLRGYSFSDSSTFGFGITQGLVFALILLTAETAFIPIITFLPIIISIIFNARIGIIIVFISLSFYFTSNFKKFLKFFLIIGSCVWVSLVIINKNSSTSLHSETITWAIDFFVETFDFISGKSNGESTYDALTGRMLFFPQNFFDFIFGEGKSVFGRGSDIGYVNQFYSGGLIYVMLLLALAFKYVNKLNKVINYRKLSSIFLITILIINLKGPALFTSQSFLRLIAIIFVFGVIESIQKSLINKPSNDDNSEKYY